MPVANFIVPTSTLLPHLAKVCRYLCMTTIYACKHSNQLNSTSIHQVFIASSATEQAVFQSAIQTKCKQKKVSGMQDIMADSFGNDAPGASQLPAAPAPVLAVPLLDDPNDDFCRVCGFGVSIMQLHPSTCMFAVQSYRSTHSNQYGVLYMA